MAVRLAEDLPNEDLWEPFWIIQPLPRRGIVAGQYRLQSVFTFPHGKEALELQPPHLLPEGSLVKPSLLVKDDVERDVARLLDLSCLSDSLNQNMCWSSVLPIYPTSPVGPFS